MPVHKFIHIRRTEYYVKNLYICLIIITMTFQIYKSWGLLDSTKTRTGACITQNQKNWRRRKLKHKHSHSLYIGTSTPTTFEFSDLGVGQLCFKNNNQCCSCSLLSFRPTMAILTHLRKIRNTQLRFVLGVSKLFFCQ